MSLNPYKWMPFLVYHRTSKMLTLNTNNVSYFVNCCNGHINDNISITTIKKNYIENIKLGARNKILWLDIEYTGILYSFWVKSLLLCSSLCYPSLMSALVSVHGLMQWAASHR